VYERIISSSNSSLNLFGNFWVYGTSESMHEKLQLTPLRWIDFATQLQSKNTAMPRYFVRRSPNGLRPFHTNTTSLSVWLPFGVAS